MRISFSQAKQKLIYTMNHTKFSNYGLLKLFLKNLTTDLVKAKNYSVPTKMNTAIFWTVQQNTMANLCGSLH